MAHAHTTGACIDACTGHLEDPGPLALATGVQSRQIVLSYRYLPPPIDSSSLQPKPLRVLQPGETQKTALICPTRFGSPSPLHHSPPSSVTVSSELGFPLSSSHPSPFASLPSFPQLHHHHIATDPSFAHSLAPDELALANQPQSYPPFGNRVHHLGTSLSFGALLATVSQPASNRPSRTTTPISHLPIAPTPPTSFRREATIYQAATAAPRPNSRCHALQ
jgi:hypothetical protein